VAAEADKTLVRRLFEDVWNQGNIEAAGEIVAEHYSSIENQVFPSTPGPQIVAADLELYRSLYDGLHFEIERMFTEGHTIVTIWTASGTSKVETFVNRSGREQPKSLKAEGVSLSEVRDGKITAHRFLWPRDPLFP
jgi:ketosteroid isomerase-like protein